MERVQIDREYEGRVNDQRDVDIFRLMIPLISDINVSKASTGNEWVRVLQGTYNITRRTDTLNCLLVRHVVIKGTHWSKTPAMRRKRNQFRDALAATGKGLYVVNTSERPDIFKLTEQQSMYRLLFCDGMFSKDTLKKYVFAKGECSLFWKTGSGLIYVIGRIRHVPQSENSRRAMRAAMLAVGLRTGQLRARAEASAQGLLDMGGVRADRGPWTVLALVASQADVDACVVDGYTPLAVRGCFIDRMAAETTPQKTTIALDGLPIQITKPATTIRPLADTGRVGIALDRRVSDFEYCALLELSASNVHVERLDIDVSRCVTAQINALFAQSVATQTALVIGATRIANVTVSDTRVVGGDWAAAIMPEMDERFSGTQGIRAVDAKDVFLQITHIGASAIITPGIILLLAVDAIDLTLLKDTDGLLSTHAAVLYKTMPGPLSDDIVVRPANARILDISAYPYLPRAKNTIAGNRELWECTNAFASMDTPAKYKLVHREGHSETPLRAVITAGIVAICIAALVDLLSRLQASLEHHSCHLPHPDDIQ